MPFVIYKIKWTGCEEKVPGREMHHDISIWHVSIWGHIGWPLTKGVHFDTLHAFLIVEWKTKDNWNLTKQTAKIIDVSNVDSFLQV